MIRRWLRDRRRRLASTHERIADHDAAIERTEAELERVKEQWPTVHEHRRRTSRELAVNHIGDAVVAAIRGNR